MNIDDIFAPIAFIIGLCLGLLVASITFNNAISKEKIVIADKLCGERQIEWMTPVIVKCKDGARYENYDKN